MKNLKKVLAMVLAFACTFTMFASAKVYTDVPAGSQYSEAITMLSDLGIIKGKSETEYKPNDTITRAEACALIARLLTGDPDVSHFDNAQNFTDVVKGSWQASAIGYCVANGIAIGVGNGKFDPNRPINDQEFLTMMVRALGYETPDVKQNYPFGYMTAAKNIGLVENTQMLAGTDAQRGEDAQVIYNALFVDYAKGAKIYNTTHGSTVERYPTLAESVWGLHQAAVGTWNKKDSGDVELSNCKAHTWVIIGEAKDEEDALLAYPIDDTEGTTLYKADEKKNQYKTYKFKYDGDADALKGYKVELWGAGKHGAPVWEKDGDKFVYSKDWTIEAIKTVAGQTKYDYNSSMADKKADDGSIVIDADTTLSLDSVADNAKNVKHADEIAEVATFLGNELNTFKIDKSKDVEKALNVYNGMQFRLMDWDGDEDIDWVVVDEARYYKVESASKKRVTVTSMKGDKKLESDQEGVPETWKIDEVEKIGTNDAKKDIKIKYEGTDGLKEGDIVEVTYKVTFEDKAQLITATVKTIDADNQKLEKVGTRDRLTLTFGDKELKVAQNAQLGDVIVPASPDKYKSFNGEELGKEFALYKNRNGFIVYSDSPTKSSNYMMVLNTYGGRNSTGNRNLAVIDMLDSNNSVRNDVKVSSTVSVLDSDGTPLKVQLGKENETRLAYDSTNRAFDEGQVVGRVFKYWTDADGVITKMQSAFSTDIQQGSTSNNYEYRSGADRLIDKGNNNRYVSSLERADAVFAVKPDYIKSDTNGGVIDKTFDLKVNSADVLATKQKDIPDINTDPAPAKMLGEGLVQTLPNDTKVNKVSWLGDKDTPYQFVVEMNKNSEASAAILGVNNFNKFGAGETKLALVTNVSEDSKGVIEAEVAFDGKVETVASVEKQKFEDIVKVYNGSEDKSVGRADTAIDAPGNGVFHGKKLSELVNNGGQYAEISLNSDGKLTKLVFMDDDTTNGNQNKLRGHHYSVSRNLVREVRDKNLRFHLNDNKTYGDVKAAQYYAGTSNKLKTVQGLPSESYGYAADAKFYQIDGTPTRHDKTYTGTQLTVNEGFDRLRPADISVIEKKDVAANEPNFSSEKNVYEVADLAVNSNGDLVAVFSFKKSMDQDAKYTGEATNNKYNVTGVQFAKLDGNKTGRELNTISGKNDQFVVYVEGSQVNKKAAEPVTGLTKDNFEVVLGGTGTQPTIENVTPVKDKDGFYLIDLNMDLDGKRAVKVSIVKGGSAESVGNNSAKVEVEDLVPELGNGEGGATPDRPISPEAAKASDIVVTNAAATKLTVEVLDQNKTKLTNLQKEDFVVTVGGREYKVSDVEYNSADQNYNVSCDGISDWTAQKNVVVTVGTRTETYDKVGSAPAIEFEKTTYDYILGNTTTDPVVVGKVLLTNMDHSERANVTVGEITDGGSVAPEANKSAVNIDVNTGNVTVAKETLDKANQVMTIKLKATTGIASSAEVTTATALTINITNPSATVESGAYTIGEETLTLTLKEEPTERVKKALEAPGALTLVTPGATSIFATGNLTTVKSVSVQGKTVTVTLTLDQAATGKYNKGSEFDVEKVLSFNDVAGEANVAFGKNSKITVTRSEKLTPSLKKVEVGSSLLFETGLAADKVTALAQEIGSNGSQYFEVKSGTNKLTIAANAVTAVAAEGTALKLTLTNALEKGGHVTAKFTGSSLYDATEEVASDVAEAQTITFTTASATDKVFTALTTSESTLTLSSGIEKGGLRVQIVPKGQSFNYNSAKVASATLNGVTATLDKGDTLKVTLTGQFDKAENVDILVGTKDGVSGKMEITVGKLELTGTVTGLTTSVSNGVVTIATYSDLHKEVKTEIEKLTAATVENSGAATSGQTVTAFTTNGDGTFNITLSAAPNTTGTITIDATVDSMQFIESLKITGSVDS